MARPQFIYSFAASLDGFLADAEGGVEWLNEFPAGDYGMNEFFRSIDVIVMGRLTYEIGLKLGMPSMGVRTIVLSRSLKPTDDLEVWSGTLRDLSAELEATGSKRVWVMGGGHTAGSLLDAGLLDTVEITTIPVALGAGIPMFSKLKHPVRFTLDELKPYDNGVVMRRYNIAGAESR